VTASPARPAPPALLAGAAVVLAVAASLAAALGWPLPERTLSGWQVADVPASLLTLIVGVAVVCLVVASALVRAGSLGSRTATWTWRAVGVLAAAALVWNDLYFAALNGGGAIIPVFDWLFAFVPALILGVTTRGLGRPAQLRAVLGTAVITLPLLGLGWAVTGEGGAVLEGLAEGMYAAAIFGVVPLVIAYAITRAPANRTPVLAP
jgi:hypothetical protein